MKASEVLKRYAAGRRDFSGESLRGQSFKGKDLSGANFSEADIRGANFTKAKLTGENFSGAKAGLQRRWAIVLVISSWILAGISGIFPGFAGGFVAYIFDSSSTANVIAGWVSLITLAVFFFIILRKGLIAGAGTAAGAVGGVGAFAGAGAITVALAVAVAGAGAVVGAFAGALAVAVVGAVTVALAVTVTFVIAVVGAVTVALAVAVAGAGGGAVAGTFAFAVAFAVTLFSAYIGWRAIKGDKRDAWIRGVAITLAATGGTSFRHADLTDADFTSAKLKSTDLRQATLIRTCFHQTQKLDRVRPGITYIKDAQVRQLLIIATAIAVRTHHLVETFHRNVSTTVRNVLIDVSTAILDRDKLRTLTATTCAVSTYKGQT